ncbi:MAG TPA: NAD-dependent epimerase/dehydratase family protein, partial [Puia sp.]|nr:NAD-dependent epimerase/dehydratase family protein [Puia sp.]
MRKVLVTGATGFIGPYVIRRLLQTGHAVIASSANPEKARSQPWFNEVSYIPLDFSTVSESSRLDYFDFFDRPDLLIHL